MLNEQKQKVAIFDLDGTLINGDSTIEFVDYFLKQQKSKKNYIKFLLGRFFNFCGLFYILGKDWRYWAVSLLKGVPINVIVDSAKLFSNEYLKKITNTNILDEAQKLQRNGYKIIILSGSIDLVVNSFVDLYKFWQGVGSSLRVNDNNICQGEFKEDILKHKESIIKILNKQINIDLTNSYAFSDNKGDLYWMRQFAHRYGVVDSYSNGYFWRTNNEMLFYKMPALRINPFWLYIPFAYSLYTRYKTIQSVPFEILDYVNPSLLIINYFINIRYAASDFILAILISYIIGYSAYEIGYIVNDSHAFTESIPSYRIDKSVLSRMLSLVSIRILYILICLSILIICGYNYKCLLLFLILLGGVYYLHNNIASTSILKTITGPLLRYLRFLIPIVPFIFYLSKEIILVVLFWFISQLPQFLTTFYIYKLQGKPLMQINLKKSPSIKMFIITLMLILSMVIWTLLSNAYSKQFLILIFTIAGSLLIHPLLSLIKIIVKFIKCRQLYATDFNSPSYL